MRELLTRGAFVLGGAGAVLSGTPVGAEAEHLRCEPVYQEYEQTPDRDLLETMSVMLDTYGVEVRVQLLDEGGDEQILHADKKRGASEANAYLERTAEDCDWSDDLLSIAVVRSPRVYGVTTEGVGAEEFPDDIIKGEAEESLVKNLRDTATPMQADIDQYLQDIQEAKEAAEVPGWLVVGGTAVSVVTVLGASYWLAGRGGGGYGRGPYGGAPYVSINISSGSSGGDSGGTGGSY